MTKVYAYRMGRVTETGKAIYGICFAHELINESDAQHTVSDNVDALRRGDGTWADVLVDNAEYVILNNQGEIDIDREAMRIAAAARPAQSDDGEDEIYPYTLNN
ncbi:hypothetical protein [Achromobacter sp. 413638]|uniref:hypothetical protein n=1 Tax=Achromobacter sp. 413638 TaxID=3342385 RepID=UPI00370C6DCA